MKDIESLKKTGEAHYRERCIHNKPGEEHPKSCICERAANIWAFRKYFLPEEYRNFTIEHFDGNTRGECREKTLNTDMVLKAKESFVEERTFSFGP